MIDQPGYRATTWPARVAPTGQQRPPGGASATPAGPASPRTRLVLASLGAGVLLALSLPPFGLWVLAPLGLGGAYLILEGLGPWRRALCGFATAIGLLAPSLLWATGFNIAGYVAMVLFESAMMTLCLVAVPPARGRALAFPAAVIAFQEWIGHWPFGGVPLGTLALGQVSGPLGVTARLGGPLLVSALACGAGVALGEAWRAVRPRDPRAAALPRGPAAHLGTRGSGRSGHLLAALAATVLVLAVPGIAHAAPDGGPAVGRIRVALVQGGRRGLRQAQVNPAIVYHAQLAATASLRPPLELVLWPEDVIALGYSPLAGSPENARISSIARSLHSTVVAGVTEDIGATQFLNKAVAWGPSGRVVDTYEKIHRVPFGEYVPLRGLFKHLANLSAVPRDAVAGKGPPLMRTAAGPLAVMVSYEVFFPALGRSGVRSGGQLIIVPTNTSSYSTGQVPAQEVAAARLQAIGAGRDLLQAAPTGYSAVIDQHGRVLQRSSLGKPAVLLATVARRRGQTLYLDIGSLPVLAALGLSLAAGWVLAGVDRSAADA